MSFYPQNALTNFNNIVDVYLDYCWISLSNPNPVVVNKDYGNNPYTRTHEMLVNEIINELNKNYSSPIKSINYLHSKRLMFK